ncbi:MAG: carbohydrate kinase family protein [Candidatus Thermoplasmatota archaeon]|nr:carbohydrate kinase family protein [Candidatus Thermoplasmatota archaeon]
MARLDASLIKKVLCKLKEIDKKSLKNYNVVLLPDFFIDHFLMLNEFKDAFIKIEKIYNQGGGNIPGITQKISQGGNASNTALALKKLGFNSHLICKTNELGLYLLEYFLGRNGVDLSRVKKDGKLAITTALEFGKKHINIMLGDPGSVYDFSFDILDDKDKKLISESDILFVTNWNLNKNGTELALNTFKFAKKYNIKTFFDTGDPSSRKNEIPILIKKVLKSPYLDVIGLNELEISYYSGRIIKNIDDAIKAINSLKNKISARIDLHTANFSCSYNDKIIYVPTQKIKNKYRSTGAGDIWNAGNIFADILKFEDDERLFFANSVACYYISSPEPVPPNLENIISYISKML